MSKEKVKKPFYKKWWVWAIAIIIIAAAVGGGGADGEKTANNKSEPATSKGQDNKETKAKEKTAEKNNENGEEKTNENLIKPGTYKVGEDIPGGEYLVFANGMAYIENASDSSGNLESIIFNDNLTKGAHSYVTLNEGEYFKLQGAEAYPVDSAPSVIPEDGIYKDGMYKVGKDIPAGEYKVILTDTAMGMGYLEVSSDSSHQLDKIVTNENVQADTYITVKDGQYLKLQGLEIQK